MIIKNFYSLSLHLKIPIYWIPCLVIQFSFVPLVCLSFPSFPFFSSVLNLIHTICFLFMLLAVLIFECLTPSIVFFIIINLFLYYYCCHFYYHMMAIFQIPIFVDISTTTLNLIPVDVFFSFSFHQYLHSH